MVNCQDKFSPDFIYLVFQLFQFNYGFEPADIAGMKRIIICGTHGFWFAVSKETLTTLYNEFSLIPFVNIGADLKFIEEVITQK